MSKKTPKSIGMDLVGGCGEKPRRRMKVAEALRIYASRGFTLSYLVESNLMGRGLPNLRKHCRTNGISFPDYNPIRRSGHATTSTNA